MPETTGILRVVIEDGGNSLSPSRGSAPSPPHPSFANPAPPLPRPASPVPSPPHRSSPAASMEEQVRAILDAPGAKKFGFSTEILGKMGEKAVADLYGKIASGPKPAPASATVPAAQPAPANDEWYQRFRELQNRHDSGGKLKEEEIAELKNLSAKLSEVAEAFAVRGPEPRPTPGPSMPDGAFGLNSTPRPTPSGAFGMKATEGEPFDWDQYKKPWYEPATPEQPKLPRAEPVDPSRKATDAFGLKSPAPPAPRPRAEVVSDAEKSREQWTPAGAMNDLKGYLPAGIGKKMDAVGGAYKAASSEAAAGGAGKVGQVAAGVGEAAIAAGPAAVLAVAEVASTVLAKSINKAAANIEKVGEGMARLAANDHLGMFNLAVEHTTESLEEIPVVGKIYAAEMRLAVAPIRALAVASNAFVERGKQLQFASGPLASANAQADVRSYLADVKEAQRTGAALARLTDAQSRFDNQLRDAILPFKTALIPAVTKLVELATQGVEFGGKALILLGQGVIDILEALTHIPLIGDKIKSALDEYKGLFKPEGEGNPVGPIKDWLDLADALGVPGVAHAPDRAQQKIAGPIFPNFPDFSN